MNEGCGIGLIPCSICGGATRLRYAGVKDELTGSQFSVLECRACGVGLTSPVPKDVTVFYGPEYYVKRHGFTERLCITRRLRWLARFTRHLRTRRVLDVGCGDGSFLLHAMDSRWDVAGTELDNSRTPPGLDVRQTVESFRGTLLFDAITFWHSLEHVPDPLNTLKHAKNLLDSDGVIIVAVPDSGGFQARLFAGGWLHLDVPRHLFHFDRRSLRVLFEAVGLEVVSIKHCELEYDLMGWIQSALNRVVPTPNLFFRMLTGGTTSEGNPAERASSWLLAIVVGALSMPLTLASALLKRGGTLIFVGRHSGAPTRI